MKTFTTADLNKHVGDVTNAAQREPVFITHHKKPRFVLMAIEDYDRLRGQEDLQRAFSFNTMPSDIEDGLLALADSFERDGNSDD